jgi:membrane associated rhomboid family serine protease
MALCVGTGLEIFPPVLTTTFAILVIGGFALYVMTPEERVRLAENIRTALARALAALEHPASSQQFYDALRARTAYTIATPILIALNVVVFALMVLGSGSLGDPQTLIGWGASFGPLTTNGEWWRLFTAMFVHTGLVHLLVSVASLLSIGFILERAVGPVALAAVYVASGLIGNVVSLWSAPALSVTAGSSGAVLGVYGLLVASLTWTLYGRLQGSVPLTTVKRIGAAAIVFALYNMVTDHLVSTSELTGFAVGFSAGLVVARGIARTRPPAQRAAVVMALTLAIAVVTAAPVRGILDVRTEVAAVIAVEEKTAGLYNGAVARFRKGTLSAADLAALIEQEIMPDLHAARVRLQGLRGVPREHRRIIGDCEQFLQLREDSWRTRGAALGKSDTDMLREADRAEQAAFNAFQRIKPIA